MPKSVTQGGQHRPALYGDCETVRKVLHWESLRVGSQVCMPDPLPGPRPRQTPPGRAAGPRAMSRAECRRASALEPCSVADAARLACEGSGDPRTVPVPQELPPWYPSTLPNPSTHMPAGDHSSGLSSQPGDATTLLYPPGLQLTSWPELGGEGGPCTASAFLGQRWAASDPVSSTRQGGTGWRRAERSGGSRRGAQPTEELGDTDTSQAPTGLSILICTVGRGPEESSSGARGPAAVQYI